ncbi:MAG: hypothetical protein IPG53_23105 [Ignavibacteriales bacterium]|nr:hypothetical protein [Ignavibacteriales bacterium]
MKTVKSELQKFVEMIVVPETWFFRDQSPFMFLQEEVKSKFMRTVTQPLRILSILPPQVKNHIQS